MRSLTGINERLEDNITDGGLVFRTSSMCQDGHITKERGSIDHQGNAELATAKRREGSYFSDSDESLIPGLKLLGVKRQAALPLPLRRFVACEFEDVRSGDVIVFEDVQGNQVSTQGEVVYQAPDHLHHC